MAFEEDVARLSAASVKLVQSGSWSPDDVDSEASAQGYALLLANCVLPANDEPAKLEKLGSIVVRLSSHSGLFSKLTPHLDKLNPAAVAKVFRLGFAEIDKSNPFETLLKLTGVALKAAVNIMLIVDVTQQVLKQEASFLRCLYTEIANAAANYPVQVASSSATKGAVTERSQPCVRAKNLSPERKSLLPK